MKPPEPIKTNREGNTRPTPSWQRNLKTSQFNQNGVNEPSGGSDGFLTAHPLQGKVTLHQAFEPTTTRAGNEKANLWKMIMDSTQKKEDGWHDEHEHVSKRTL
uniref:Uncharacterized protein n=1 Tax=Salix viminalis TaxID=40686 RepID=A0A6N2LNC1_SALVM